MSAVQDELGIRRVLTQYCHLCDDRDFAALAELFSPDGRFTFGAVDAAGRPDIVAWFESNNPPDQGGKHLTLNSVCDISRPTATVTSDFVLIQQRGTVVLPVVAGRYDDVFEYTAGEWLIRHRVVRIDMVAKATGGERDDDVDEVRDDAAIRNLLARYCIALDLDDVEQWVSLFTVDAIYEVYGRIFEGHKGLSRMMEAAPGGLHLGGPPVVELTSPDSALSRRNLLFIHRSTGEQRGALYEDELVRTPEGWRIARCRCRFIVADGLSDRPG